MQLKEKNPATQLYFIRAEGEPPYIKIGIAANVRARMTNMQMACPYKLRLLKRAPFPEMERRLHDRFADHRITGEWFRPCPELLDLIDGMEGETLLEVRCYGDRALSGAMVYEPADTIEHLFMDKRDRAAIQATRKRAFQAGPPMSADDLMPMI